MLIGVCNPVPHLIRGFRPSHAIKGARWLSLSGSALDALLAAAGGPAVRFDFGNGTCFPASRAGALVPCPRPRTGSDVVISVRLWPLHSDVAVRGAARLVAASGDTDAAAAAAVPGTAWSVSNINRLQSAIVRTHLNNLHSIPQDCPHREQRGWGGDAQLTAGSAAVNLEMSAFCEDLDTPSTRNPRLQLCRAQCSNFGTGNVALAILALYPRSSIAADSHL